MVYCDACEVVLQKKEVFLREQEDVPNRGYHMADALEGFVTHFWNVKQVHDPENAANMKIKSLKKTIHGETTTIPVLVNDKVIQANSMLEWYRPAEASSAKPSAKAVGGKAVGKAAKAAGGKAAKKARTSR